MKRTDYSKTTNAQAAARRELAVRREISIEYIASHLNDLVSAETRYFGSLDDYRWIQILDEVLRKAWLFLYDENKSKRSFILSDLYKILKEHFDAQEELEKELALSDDQI
jgi:hypothetical protein